MIHLLLASDRNYDTLFYFSEKEEKKQINIVISYKREAIVYTGVHVIYNKMSKFQEKKTHKTIALLYIEPGTYHTHEVLIIPVQRMLYIQIKFQDNLYTLFQTFRKSTVRREVDPQVRVSICARCAK